MASAVKTNITSDFVSAELAFAVPPADGESAYQILQVIPGPDSGGQISGNVSVESKLVTVENIQGKERIYTLDTAGFQYFERPTKFTQFKDDVKVQEEYYPESIEIIKELTGASRVVLFDHTRRHNRPGDNRNVPGKRLPALQAHINQTTSASIARVHRHLPSEDVPALLRRRFQIINLWRPIVHPAYDTPLALCDYRSVDTKTDTFPVTLIYPDREGETYGCPI